MRRLQQKRSFGLVAKEYQKYRRSYDPKLYRLLFSLLPQAELTILDIGCGTGKSTEPLLLEAGKRKVSVVGVDPDEAMLREARLSAKKKKLSIEYIKGNAESLPFKRENFDCVISGTAFHWFGNKRAIKKIKTSLRERGIFFVFWTQRVRSNKPTIGSELYKKYKWRGIPRKFREQRYVCALLAEAGFKNVKKVTIPFLEKKTIPEIIGNLKTISSYVLMSSSAKKQFIKEITKAYERALGEKRYNVNKLELRICYGFK